MNMTDMQQVSVYLPEDLYQAVREKLSHEPKTSFARLVRELLEEYLKTE